MPQIELHFNRLVLWKGLQMNKNEEEETLDLLVNFTCSSFHHT